MALGDMGSWERHIYILQLRPMRKKFGSVPMARKSPMRTEDTSLDEGEDQGRKARFVCVSVHLDLTELHC